MLFNWIKRSKKKIEPKDCNSIDHVCDLDQLRHEIRNAMLGIHHERQETKRALTAFARAYLSSYELTSKHLRRVEEFLVEEECTPPNKEIQGNEVPAK